MTAPQGLPAHAREDRGLPGLLDGILRGDQASFAAFYDGTSPWVYGLALKILGDPATAEEVTLDVYVQVWRQAGSYSRDRGSPQAWLLVMTRTRALDRLRSGAIRRRRESRLGEDIDLPADGPDPLATTSEAERRRLVTSAVASLPEDQRRAIALAYFGGLTHTQVADRLGEPLGTVKTRIRLGMAKLRERLRPLEESA